MAVTTMRPSSETPRAAEPVLGRALRPGIVLLNGPGGIGEPWADERALALLGCRDRAELAARWPVIRQRLLAEGLRLADASGGPGTESAAGSGGPSGTSAAAPGSAGEASAMAAAEVELPPDLTGGRHLRVALVSMDGPGAGPGAGSSPGAGSGPIPGSVSGPVVPGSVSGPGSGLVPGSVSGPGSGLVPGSGSSPVPGSGSGIAAAGNGRQAAPAALLLQDAELAAALESDLRAASQMRSLAQITPAVAHDLRAPINAMVLNLEVLKETLAAPPSTIPGNPAYPGQPQRPAGRDPRERQQRYVAVLREELSRLHQSLELYLAHVSPRGERLEALDLRGPAQDLAALLRPPAHKQQARIELLLPDAAVPVLAQRHQLRQALLHLGLAALERVPRDGTLEIRLERQPARARARLWIAARARPGTAPAAPAASTMPAPASAIAMPAATPAGPRFSAAGTEARQQVAHDIVASFGGTSRPAGPDGAAVDPVDPAASAAAAAFEVEFPLAESN
jgi:hypothetical protein